MRDTNLALIKEAADRALGKSTRPAPLSEGVSSDIYQLTFDEEVAYLKLSATEQESLFPEYLAYQSLMAAGVNAPRVLYYCETDSSLQRSLLIISRIPGRPIAGWPRSNQRDNALAAAGSELAKINTIRIDRYGYVDFSKGVNAIAGRCGSLADFVLDGVVEGLAHLVEAELISKETGERCGKLFAQASQYLVPDYPRLLHGDFTSRHIFYDGDAFTGIIDFGNIRGGSRYHDLAHLRVFDGQRFSAVLRGYQAVAQLPADAERSIAFEAIAILLSKVNWMSRHQPERLNRYRWVGYYLDHEANVIERYIA